MATPVSKRIQQDRKSTFLDNISARAGEEQQKKKKDKKKEPVREKTSEKGTKRKLGKTAVNDRSSKKVCAMVLFSDKLSQCPVLSLLYCTS